MSDGYECTANIHQETADLADELAMENESRADVIDSAVHRVAHADTKQHLTLREKHAIMSLKEDYDMTHDEIAAVFGISHNTVNYIMGSEQ